MIPEILYKILKIYKSIDRIRISIPLRHYDKLLNQFKQESYNITTKCDDRNIVTTFYIKNSIITLCLPKHNDHESYNPRIYLQLLQPDRNIQNYVKSIIKKTCPINLTYKHFNPCITQLEIAFDIIPNDHDDINEIESFINRHTNLQYSRKNSISRISGTRYQGKDGNARLGSKGIRIYRKTIDGVERVRIEIQFNSYFLYRNKFSIDMFPLSTKQYDLFDFLELLNDFSREGVRNIARTILRKRGCTPVSDKNYLFRLNVRTHVLHQYISRGFAPGQENQTTVAEQLDRFTKVKKQKGLTVHAKKYCQFDDDVNDFLSSLVRDSS